MSTISTGPPPPKPIVASPVEPFHLFRYIDEQAFRFNNRINETDSTRFAKVISQVTGKRLTYAEVTGKVGKRPSSRSLLKYVRHITINC